MLGINYLKVPPTTHVMQFKRGQVVASGAGLSFFYYGPTSVIVTVPIASTDVPFVFNEVTADYQDATIQGELTYRVVEPSRLAALLDFSIDSLGRYRTEDPAKLNDRLIHAARSSRAASRSVTNWASCWSAAMRWWSTCSRA